jgi:hypothetical protein
MYRSWIGTIYSEVAQSGTSCSLDLDITAFEKEENGFKGVFINSAHICDMSC